MTTALHPKNIEEGRQGRAGDVGEERSLGGEEQEEMALLPYELHAESPEPRSICQPRGPLLTPMSLSLGSQASFPTWSLSAQRFPVHPTPSAPHAVPACPPAFSAR